MASAFTYAGCQNLVMGLWKVSDQVSVGIMDAFYASVLDGRELDQALAEAKRAYLEQSDELTANPKLWAPLVVYGNQRVIENKKNQWILFGIAIGSLLLVAGVLLRRAIR